jgi:large subunit ribosomal protein L21
MAYAIIKTGGKQYKVNVGDKLSVDKLALIEGDWATFDYVLAHGEGESISVGAPTVSGASVVAKVLKQYKADKVIAFKFKRRKGYHKKKGHRTHKTLVQIVSINAA